MKKILLFIGFGLLTFNFAHAQYNVGQDTTAIGLGATSINPDYKFQYGGHSVPHYGLGWYQDPSFTGGPMCYLTGYGGIKLFTNGTPRLLIDNSGNVGIGTTTPAAAVDITSGALLVAAGYAQSYSSQGSYLAWNRSHGGGEVNFVNNYGSGVTQGFSFDQTGNGTTFTNLMTILGNGNVGIGTTNPFTYKLAVNGSAIATSMTVKAYTNWPDYVFKKTYKLPSLTETKTYIDKNHHLPEMPTEQQIAKDGLNLGDMNKLLVKKVEELTLYLIDKDKQIEAQKALLKSQQELLLKVVQTQEVLTKRVDSMLKSK